MANWYDEFSAGLEETYGQPSGSGFAGNPLSLDEQINAMDNSEKLSGTERWLYKKLPGFAENSIIKALASFAEGPAGKVLNFLDKGAEALERTLGFAAQYGTQGDEDDFNWKNAWAAGSLFWDTVRLPRLQRDENGKVIGIKIDTDMPGAYALNEARHLLEQGKTIDEIKGAMYENLGALALRAQLQDTLGHVVADPLNWALAAIKPVQRLHALRHLALTNKIDVQTVRGLEAAAKAAGNLEDAAKFGEAIARAESTGKALTRVDRFIIGLTGGTPYMDKAGKLMDVSTMTTAQKWAQKLNPFALSRESIANEFSDVIAANIGEYLVRPMWQGDPEDFIKAVSNVAKGGISDQWAHLAMTLQGRTVQAVVSNADAAVKKVGQEWTQFANERRVIAALSDAVGIKVREAWEMAGRNSDSLYKQVLAASEKPGMELLRAEVMAGNLTKETLERIGRLPLNVPLTKDEFFTGALVTIQDVAMQQAVLQFGITEKGVFTKWMDALKAWETLPFIRANPANAIRNIINNDVTMIARGVYGTLSESTIKSVWAGKWMPPQMKRAFAFGGIDEFDATKATETLVKALEGKGDSWAQKVKNAAKNLKLGPTVGKGDFKGDAGDFSRFSKGMEAKASLRASTVGWLEFHTKYWNKRTGFTSVAKYFDSNVADELEEAMPGITKMLDDIAQDAGTDPDKLKDLLKFDLDTNAASVFEEASVNLGYKIDDVLGAEVGHIIKEGLPKAIKNGSVKELFDGVKTMMENHVDNLFSKHVENLPGIVAAQVQAGGPMQFHRVFGKAIDEFWGGNIEHSMRMSTINELMDYARQTGDFKKAGVLWEKIMADGDKHFSRIWTKFDAYQEGLRQGAKNAGIKYPTEVNTAFKEIRSGWEELFKFRKDEYKKFFDAKLSGTEYKKAFEEIQGQVQRMYEDMVSKEDELYQRVDDLMAGMLDDTAGGMYKNYRDQVAALRLQDRKLTTEFFKSVRNAPKDEVQKLWTAYWQKRAKNLEAIRAMEARGSSAIQGDGKAAAMFARQTETEPGSIFEMAARYGIPSASANGKRNNRRILNTVNKYSEASAPTEKIEEVLKSANIPEDVIKAYVTRANYKKTVDEIRALMKEAPLGEEHSRLVTRLQEANNKLKGSGYELSALAKKNNMSVEDLRNITEKSYKYTNVDDIPLDVAKQAFDARATKIVAGGASGEARSFIPDAEKIFPDPMPIETGLSELNYGRSYAALDSLYDVAAGRKTSSKMLSNLPDHLQKKVEAWTRGVSGEMNSFRAAGVQYAAFRRDSALLNYSRRTNFDNFVGNFAPFAFWTTHSVFNWAIHSLDRPAMLTSYFRTRQFFETAGLKDQNVPSRLKGNIRVNLPFTPDWMGDTFIDPLRILLPVDSWMQPWENAQASKFTLEGKTKATLEQMLEAGRIDEETFNRAIETQSGPAWEEALNAAQEGGDNYNAMDFVQMTMTPHAPLMWAYNAATGQKNEIGPFTPMTRTVKNFATMMGVSDWSNSPYNLEARLRKEMGLPAYDKWDDYRVGRQISNLAADGNHDMNAVNEAMQIAAMVEAGQMTSEEAVKTNELYALATKRANEEYAGGWAGSILSFLGIHVKAYPTGEQTQRELGEKFSDAYAEYENGNIQALTDFFDEYPEYESRLALFKSPEERLKTFMVDNIWTRWNELPDLTQKEIAAQLGPNFQTHFLDTETRNYDNLSPTQLQVYLKLMGGKPVGSLSTTDEILIELNQLKLTDPETAWRVQTFYDMRNGFENWNELQNQYYNLPENKRAEFAKSNPELREYWDARRDWMSKNPDLVRFLTDDPKQLKKYENSRRMAEFATPTADEIRSNISQPTMELIAEWSYGQPLPSEIQKYLNDMAAAYGIDTRTMLGILTGR